MNFDLFGLIFSSDLANYEFSKNTWWIYAIIMTATTFVFWRFISVFVLFCQNNIHRLNDFSKKTESSTAIAIEACPIAGLVGTFAALTSALAENSATDSQAFIFHITQTLGLALPTTLAGMLMALICMVLAALTEYLCVKAKGTHTSER